MIYLNTVKNYYISLQQYLCSVVNKDVSIQTLPRIWRKGQSSFWGHKLFLITFFAVVAFVFIIWSIFLTLTCNHTKKRFLHTLHDDPANTVIYFVKNMQFSINTFSFRLSLVLSYCESETTIILIHTWLKPLSHSLCIVASTKAGILLPGKSFSIFIV